MVWTWFKDLFTTLGAPLQTDFNMFGLRIPSVDIFALFSVSLIVLLLTSSIYLLFRSLRS
jgi:hypothetical protein